MVNLREKVSQTGSDFNANGLATFLPMENTKTLTGRKQWQRRSPQTIPRSCQHLVRSSRPSLTTCDWRKDWVGQFADLCLCFHFPWNDILALCNAKIMTSYGKKGMWIHELSLKAKQYIMFLSTKGAIQCSRCRFSAIVNNRIFTKKVGAYFIVSSPGGVHAVLSYARCDREKYLSHWNNTTE